MKAITLEAGRTVEFGRPVLAWRGASGRATARQDSSARTRRSTPFTVVQPIPELRSSAAAQKSTSIWLPPQRENLGERVFMVALTVAAVVGIAYGFSLMLDLVEGWAGFHATVSSLLQ